MNRAGLRGGTLYISILEAFGSNLSQDTGYAETSRGLPQSLQENSRRGPRIGNDHFIPKLSQFFIQHSFYHPTLHSLATISIVKNPLTNN
jgi:hypothetical protein